MPLRLLCLGDIHLGARPSRIPVAADGAPPLGELGPTAAWMASVDRALTGKVDAVLLAGDVCDSDNARHEAWHALTTGVGRLAAGGIPVFAVAGNHDVETLPRLVADVDGVQMLGAGGRWESVVIEGADGDRCRLFGWSFPRRRVAVSPLAEALPKRTDDLPVLGLLHCDLDGSGDYAPVRSAELRAAPVDQWLLGHIHRPSLTADSKAPGYLGSICGRDPGEAGARGPWLVEVSADGAISRRHLPLAPLRWELRDIEIAPRPFDRDDFESLLRNEATRLADERAAAHDELRALGIRFRLTGSSPDLPALHRAAEDFSRASRVLPHARLFLFLDHRMVIDVEPALDLEQLALGSDPPALLAGQILALRRRDEEGRRLVAEARPRLAEATEAVSYRSLDATTVDDEAARRALIRAGNLALAEMLAQREAQV